MSLICSLISSWSNMPSCLVSQAMNAALASCSCSVLTMRFAMMELTHAWGVVVFANYSKFAPIRSCLLILILAALSATTCSNQGCYNSLATVGLAKGCFFRHLVMKSTAWLEVSGGKRSKFGLAVLIVCIRFRKNSCSLLNFSYD